MLTGAGQLITDTLDYDGGRHVSVYVPPEPVRSAVFAADGAWHASNLSSAFEAAGATSTMVVGVHGMLVMAQRDGEHGGAFVRWAFQSGAQRRG